MPEFFQIKNITDVLSILGFFIGLIMFIPWLRQYEQITKRIFSVQNLKYLFLTFTVCFLYVEKLELVLITIVLWWLCSVYIFFSKSEKKISELKSNVFLLVVDTSITIFFLALYLVANIYSHVGNLYDSQTDNLIDNNKLSERVKKLESSANKSLPNKPLKQDK